jgi:hypothetical protein
MQQALQRQHSHALRHTCLSSTRLVAQQAALARHRCQPARRKSQVAAVAGEVTNNSAGPVTEPTERVLKLWREANAVCFDVDCE